MPLVLAIYSAYSATPFNAYIRLFKACDYQFEELLWQWTVLWHKLFTSHTTIKNDELKRLEKVDLLILDDFGLQSLTIMHGKLFWMHGLYEVLIAEMPLSITYN
jgi:DNA replication protein DnaC